MIFKSHSEIGGTPILAKTRTYDTVKVNIYYSQININYKTI
jgi:hypothetical protein